MRRHRRLKRKLSGKAVSLRQSESSRSRISLRAARLASGAAIIGVGVGTLKVKCSRLGISLRRPRVKLLPPRTTGAARTVGADGEIATFTISMKYKGQERNTALPLTPNMISQLALEASFRDQRIGELAKDLVESVMKNGLFKEVLGE